MGLLLKVLSGPHQGAEFDVPDEEIIIGSADECDVIISDALVANKHVKFGLSENHIFVTPLEGNVFIDGKLLREPSTVDNFKFITIGATHMMVGEADSEQWKTIVLGEFPELEKVVEEVAKFDEPAALGSETIEGVASEEAGINSGNSTQKMDGPSAEDILEKDLDKRKVEQADKAGKIKLTLKQKIIRYTSGFAICFAISLAVSIATVLVKDHKSLPPPKPESLEVRVQKAVDALKLNAKLKISKANEDSAVSVVGYVITMEDSAAVKSTAKGIAEEVTVKILSMEKIVNSATEMVKQSKQSVVLKKSEEFGEVVATGYIKKEETWENLKTEILSIKGIIGIKDEVLVKSSAVDLAKSVLEEHKFKDKLEVAANDSGVEIKGTISDNDKESWSKTRDDLEKAFKKKAQLSFMIAVSTDRNLTIEKFFGGKIDSVNFNSQGLDWINIKGGNKYFQGSVLPSGYVIDLIEQTSVTIKNAEEVIKLEFDWI
jgi:type III secretion system YscD/HrpQ family protein